MSDVHPDPDAFEDEAPTTVTHPAEDLAFVLDPSRRPSVTEDSRRRVLEVHQTWGELVIDSHHAAHGTLTAGSATGFRWKLLGQDIAWVPRPLAQVLPFAPPMWSEVDTTPRADLPLPEDLDNGEVVPFFQERDGTWEALVRPGWSVMLTHEDGSIEDLDALATTGRVRPESDGIAAVAIPDGVTVTLAAGDVALHGRVVPASRRVATSVFDNVDGVFLGLLGVAAVLAACFAVMVVSLPGNPDGDVVELAERFADAVEWKQKPPPEPERAPVASNDGAASPQAPKEPGKVGKRDAPNERSQGAAEQQADREVAMGAGVLGALSEMGMNEGMGGGVGDDLLADIGGLIGVKGAQRGDGGLSSRGDSLGGGGPVGSIGGVGVGCPPGARCARDGGAGNGSSWAKEAGVVTLQEERHIIGGLDARLVDETIKRHINQIRYCYQRQLTRNPSLRGKVVSRFVIAQDGSVSKADTKTSSMGNAEVESCINARIMRMQFPEPRGGIVIVSYPFMFSPG